MKVEDSNALRFILQDELYLLEEDKHTYSLDNLRGAEPQPQIETLPPSFNYLGANKKNFLILVNYAEHEFIADDHLTALESVLSRKGHNRDDVVILNMAKYASAMYEQLNDHFKPKTLLILGQEAIPAGLKQPQFNLRESNDDLNLLFTFSFGDMMTSNENKKAFWDQVKSL